MFSDIKKFGVEIYRYDFLMEKSHAVLVLVQLEDWILIYVSHFECNVRGPKHVSSNFASLAILNTRYVVANTVAHSIMHI